MVACAPEYVVEVFNMALTTAPGSTGDVALRVSAGRGADGAEVGLE